MSITNNTQIIQNLIICLPCKEKTCNKEEQVVVELKPLEKYDLPEKTGVYHLVSNDFSGYVPFGEISIEAGRVVTSEGKMIPNLKAPKKDSFILFYFLILLFIFGLVAFYNLS